MMEGGGAILVLPAIALVAIALLLRAWRKVNVLPGTVALVYRDGALWREMSAGRHRFFDFFGKVLVIPVALAPRALDNRQIEVISRDRFAFRLTITPLVTISDAPAFVENGALPAAPPPRGGKGWTVLASLTGLSPMGGSGGPLDLLMPAMVAAVVEAVAARTLGEFLKDPRGALAPIEAELAAAAPGVRLDALKLTAIILPPELRKMFTEVERARAEGQASLERARSEQAALRVLANAARTLVNNPELARLRQWQVMENARGAKTFVLGTAREEVVVEPGSV